VLDSYDAVSSFLKIDYEKTLPKIHNGVESEAYIASHAHQQTNFDAADLPKMSQTRLIEIVMACAHIIVRHS